jgi:hypothetical protein
MHCTVEVAKDLATPTVAVLGSAGALPLVQSTGKHPAGRRVLDEPRWAGRLTERDLRGLTPLFWSNVALHGMFERDLDKRID